METIGKPLTVLPTRPRRAFRSRAAADGRVLLSHLRHVGGQGPSSEMQGLS